MTRRHRIGSHQPDAARTLRCRRQFFQLHDLLLEHPDRAVGRDGLVAAVWSKTDIGDIRLGQTIRCIHCAAQCAGGESQRYAAQAGRADRRTECSRKVGRVSR